MNIGGNSIFRNKTIAAIEVCQSLFKLAVAEDGKNGRTVTKLVKKELSGKETMGEALSREGISFDELVIILPRNQVTVRNLELPSADPQEIRDIINIQAGKQTPFPREELIADFLITGSSCDQRYARVLLAIAQKAPVNSYLDSLREKKDKVVRVAFGPECRANWYQVIRNHIKDKVFATVYFNLGFSDFSVISDGKLIFTRLLDIDTSAISVDVWRKRFEEEIGFALRSYKEENIGPPFDKIVFLDMNRFEADSRDILNKCFSLQASGPFDAAQFLRFSGETRQFLVQQEKEGISYSNLLGYMIDPGRPALDFSPLDIKVARRERTRRKEFITAGILIVAVALVGLALFLEGVYSKSMVLRRMNAQLEKLEKETAGIQRESSTLDQIKKRLDSRISAIGVLTEIYKLAPQDVYLSAIVYDDSGSISLRGTSMDMSGAFKLVKMLKESPLFGDVKTKYVTKRKDLSDFEIVCQLAEK